MESRKFTAKPVVDWKIGDDVNPGNAIKITLSWDNHEEDNLNWVDVFSAFLENPASREVDTLIVGYWWEEEAVDAALEAVVAANGKLPNLRHLFFGDIDSEESEISWIIQTDLSPIFEAYPQLETFYCRGGASLLLGSPNAPKLQTLVVEASDIPQEVVRGIMTAKLPELRYLELWLGDEEYAEVENLADFEPLFSGELFPKLEHLGLRNAALADDLAIALASSPLLGRLKGLDFTYGTLGDRGGQALLANQHLSNLEYLNFSDNYLTKPMVERFKALPVKVYGIYIGQDTDIPEDDRYVVIRE
jgi:hypothetical protein